MSSNHFAALAGEDAKRGKRPAKREKDRQSASSPVKNAFQKKRGHGKGNWGSELDQVGQAQMDQGQEATQDQENPDAVAANAEKPVTAVEEEEEPIKDTVTLNDFLGLNKAAESKSTTGKKKKKGGRRNRKGHKILDISRDFGSIGGGRGRGGRGRGRGGRGRGRGRGRGGGRGYGGRGRGGFRGRGRGSRGGYGRVTQGGNDPQAQTSNEPQAPVQEPVTE